MFSFLGKKAPVARVVFAALLTGLLVGTLLVSCQQPTNVGGGGNSINAATPNISVQPQDGTFDVVEDTDFKFTVTASVTDGGQLSYQWYKANAAAASGGTVISGETNATLTLDSGDYTENKAHYFYVVVTNTNSNATGNKTAATTSNVATVTVDGVDGIYFNAQKPVIRTQPTDAFWNVFTPQTGVKLTVEANVKDGGQLSYQWYKVKASVASGGTEINEASSKDYTLTKTEYAENGVYYFYVVATNTNNAVEGKQTNTVASNAVKVTVVGYPDTEYTECPMPDKLKGNWESEYDEIFTVSAHEFSSGMEWEGEWSGYKGTIAKHRGNTNGTAGYITIKFTECSWDEDAKGKYYVIHYWNLTETTVTIAGAGSFMFADPDFGDSGGRTSQDEAEATYTVSAGYFAMASDAEKTGSPNILFLNGLWVSSFGDFYNINTNAETIEYDMGSMPGYGLKADILDVVTTVASDGVSGVIYIYMTERPLDFFTQEPVEGDYTGIYFKGVTATSSKGFYEPTVASVFVAAETLEEAKETFNLTNYDTHVGSDLIYAKFDALGSGGSHPNKLEGTWGDDDYEMYNFTITETTIKCSMDMFGTVMDVFVGDIYKVVDKGATGYIIFKYRIMYSGMGDPDCRDTYTVLAWESYNNNTVAMAVADDMFYGGTEEGEATATAAEVKFSNGDYDFDFTDFIRQ